MAPLVPVIGYYDYQSELCLEPLEEWQKLKVSVGLSPNTPESYTDPAEQLTKRHQILADRFRRLGKKIGGFDANTNVLIRKISDWVSGAGKHRVLFQENLQQAASDLSDAEQTLRRSDWSQTYSALENANTQLSSIEKGWRQYIATTSDGAESILQGLRVVRNGSLAFAGAGVTALTLGAGTAMTGALAASMGTHAGFLSLPLWENEPIPQPEIISLEYVEREAQGQEKGNEEQSSPLASAKPVSKSVQPARSETTLGRGKKKSLETKPQLEATNETKQKPPTGLLTMRDKSVEVSPPSDVGPKIDVSPSKPRPLVQNATGTYFRYEDGGTLVRNPALGSYSLSKEAKVDDSIVVDKSGEVSGVPVPSTISTDRIVSGASSADLLSSLLINAGSNVAGKVVQVIFVIDTSKSMESARTILGEAIEKTLIELQTRFAKEIYFGVVIFRDCPTNFSSVFVDEDRNAPGIHVLEYPRPMNGRTARELGEKIKRLKLDGGKEPAGLALQSALGLFRDMPISVGPVLRQVVVISDHEGLNTMCGDHFYPEEEQYLTIRTHVNGIAISAFLIPNGSQCGCLTNCTDG